MMRALWSAASGMIGQQFNIDTISNNLSNVNTAGFKKARVDFEDLIYQSIRRAGTPATINTMYPTGVEVGLGTRVAATQKMYTQGSPQLTENKTDLCIFGEGFFKIRMPDGTEAYTRNGSFTVDANGDLVTAHGNYVVEPPITLPRNYIKDSLTITQDGKVTYRIPQYDDDIVAGQIHLYRFVNPAGLKNIGNNMVKETVASGAAFEGIPASSGYGQTLQGFLEMSNVKIVEEMVSMIVAQRAYEFNSKAIQTSDSMLGSAVMLKR